MDKPMRTQRRGKPKKSQKQTSGDISIENVLQEWQRARPELDISPLGLFAAIAHAYWVSAPKIEGLMSKFDLTRGMFDVLTTLRRSGPPFELPPKELSRRLLLSGAGMTNRLDRLEDLELIVGTPDPNDRRGLQIKITQAGLAVVDRILPELIELEIQMATALTHEDTSELIKLLDKLTLNDKSETAPQ